jgi:hypothetical protein
MNALIRLNDLIAWHTEQANELDREQDGQDWAEFHREAVELLKGVK